MTRFRTIGALILLLVGAAVLYAQEQQRLGNIIVLNRMDFAAGVLTSGRLATGLSDETGTGLVVYNASPALTGSISGLHGFARQSVVVDGVTTFGVTSTSVFLLCTGAEDINTITGGVAGMRIFIEHGDTDCTIKDDETATAADAIDVTGGADDAGAVNKILVLYYNGTHWLEASESDN